MATVLRQGPLPGGAIRPARDGETPAPGGRRLPFPPGGGAYSAAVRDAGLFGWVVQFA